MRRETSIGIKQGLCFENTIGRGFFFREIGNPLKTETRKIGMKKECQTQIYVIDSTTIAMMVSLISRGEPIRCIFEKQMGMDNGVSFDLIKNFAKKCLNIQQSEDIEVPSRYYLDSKDPIRQIRNLIGFRKKMDNAYQEENAIYIGPITSSIMSSLRCDKNSLKYLYHGSGDYIKYLELKNRNQNSLKLKVKNMIIGKLIQLPTSIWSGYFCFNGYSMTDLADDRVKWLNYMDFQSCIIEKELQALKNQLIDGDNILFCPVSAIHNADGIDNDTTKFDDINIELLRKHITKKCKIFIKFHPSLYLISGLKTVTDLTDLIKRKLNVQAIDIANFVPATIGGPIIPLEILFRYIGFNTLVCTETSTVWNLSKNRKIIKKLNIEYMDKKRIDTYAKKLIKLMTEINVINESFVINI